MQTRILFALFFVPVTTLFGADYAFLKDVKGVVKIQDGERTIYVVGERHPSRNPLENDLEVAVFEKATSEALKAAAAEKLVFIHEHTNRSEKAEAAYLKRRGLDASKWTGAYRGLEDPAIKAYTIIGLVNLTSRQHREAISQLKSDKLNAEETANMNRMRDGSRMALFGLYPQLVFTATLEPSNGYWDEVRKDPKLGNNAQFLALDKVVKAGTRLAYEEYEKTLLTDPEEAGLAFSNLPAITALLGEGLMTDPNLDKALREKLPKDVFKGATVETDDFRKFMEEGMTPLREEAMVTIVADAAKTFPKHDILIMVGRVHQAPLEKRLRELLQK